MSTQSVPSSSTPPKSALISRTPSVILIDELALKKMDEEHAEAMNDIKEAGIDCDIEGGNGIEEVEGQEDENIELREKNNPFLCLRDRSPKMKKHITSDDKDVEPLELGLVELFCEARDDMTEDHIRRVTFVQAY